MLVTVDVVDPGNSWPEFGLRPDEGLKSKVEGIKCESKELTGT